MCFFIALRAIKSHSCEYSFATDLVLYIITERVFTPLPTYFRLNGMFNEPAFDLFNYFIHDCSNDGDHNETRHDK